MVEANRRIRESNALTASAMAQHGVPVLDADGYFHGWLGADACPLYEDWVHIGAALHVRLTLHEMTGLTD